MSDIFHDGDYVRCVYVEDSYGILDPTTVYMIDQVSRDYVKVRSVWWHMWRFVPYTSPQTVFALDEL